MKGGGGGIVLGLIQVLLGGVVALAMLSLAAAPVRARVPFRRRGARAAAYPPAVPPVDGGSGAGVPAPPTVRAVGLLGPAIVAGIGAAPAAGARRPARHGRLRRAGLVALLAFSVLCSGLGLYTWQVSSALSEAQQAIYVPLPPEPAPVATTAPDASEEPAATPTPAPLTPTTAPPPGALGQVGAVFDAATATEDPGLDPIWRGKRYVNVLVLGFDSREDDTGPPRSDVFLLAQLDLQAKTVNIVSIPRDLWLAIPGYGEDRINAAYPLGWRANQPAAGVALAKKTVEQNFGLPIDYYVAVDFRGFQQVVDAVGGVEVDVPYYLRDDEYPTEDYGIEKIEFFPGKQRMDGKTALKYVRTRHQDSDYGRRRRQTQVLVALFERGKGVNIVPRLPGVLRSFGGTVQTNFTFEEQLALGRVALAIDRANIKTYSIDESMTGGWITPGGASVVRGDWRAIDLLLDVAFTGRVSSRAAP